MEFFLEMS